MDSGHEAFDEEEALSSRGNTPDLMMTNVTTLKPSDSEAAQIEEEEQQEDRTGNTHTCEKEVFGEINFKENEKDNDEDEGVDVWAIAGHGLVAKLTLHPGQEEG